MILGQLKISDEDEQQNSTIMDLLLGRERLKDRRNGLWDKGGMADFKAGFVFPFFDAAGRITGPR